MMTSDITLCHITPEFWNDNYKKCQQFIEVDINWQSIPLYNYITTDNIQEVQLLRFQGMIQNMLNPEIFLSKYEIKNTVTGKSTIVSGKLKDSVVCKENEKFIEDSEHNENGERETWLCVSIPALNDWVKSNWRKLHLKRQHLRSSDDFPGPTKRSSTVSSYSPNLAEGIMSIDAEDTCTVSLPKPHCRKCYLKLYDFDTSPYSLNDVVEVAGFLSLSQNLNVEDGFAMDLDVSESKIPLLHVISCRKLIPSCSLLSDISLGSLEAVRKDLHIVLSQLLLGDTLAAEYLLCHLLSSVYSRTEMMPLGQLPLNISNIPTSDYVKKVYSILELLVMKSVYFPMSLENLNGKVFTPKKNYENDELCDGLLQLSSRTHLVLDETQMDPGKLENRGVLNMAALRKLVLEQKVAYDFQYYQLDYNCDIPTLVFSEGKSLIPCSVIVPLEPDVSCLESIPEIFQAVLHFLQPSILDRMRAYLLSVQSMTFSMNQEMQQVIQEDFVKLRQNRDVNTSAEDLHNLMVLCRLMSVSMGEETLSAKSWEHTLCLETARKLRLAQTNIIIT